MERFKKTPGERLEVETAKAIYKANMRKHFGDNWKKVSRAKGYHNVPNVNN